MNKAASFEILRWPSRIPPQAPRTYAGTARNSTGDLIAVGGRVLAVTALGDDPASARKNAYEAIVKIDWDNGFYRSDIAKI